MRPMINFQTFGTVLLTQSTDMAFWPFTQPWYDGCDDLRRRYAETVIYNDDYKIDFMAQKPTMEAWNGTLVKQEKDENLQDTCKDRDLM